METLRREWARHEQVMRSIADTSSSEGSIARRAFDRLTDIAAELQLDTSIVELAHQVCHVVLCLFGFFKQVSCRQRVCFVE